MTPNSEDGPNRSRARLPLPGEVLDGRYQVTALLAQGRSAHVFSVKDLRDLSSLALRFFDPARLGGGDFPGRFHQRCERLIRTLDPGSDARSGRALQHIARPLDHRAADDGCYLISELAEGDDLDACVRRAGGVLLDETARHIYRQIGRALQAAHDQGLWHGDLTPAHIYVCHRRDDPCFVRLIGLGLDGLSPRQAALPEDPRQVAYIAPEQARLLLQGKPYAASAEADQFALACIISEMLIGRPIFCWPGRDSARDVLDHTSQYDPEIFALGPQRERALRRALHRSPEQRYPSITAFLAEFDPTPQAETVPMPRVPPEELDELAATIFQPPQFADWHAAARRAGGTRAGLGRLQRWAARRWPVALGGAVVILVLALLAARWRAGGAEGRAARRAAASLAARPAGAPAPARIDPAQAGAPAPAAPPRGPEPAADPAQDPVAAEDAEDSAEAEEAEAGAPGAGPAAAQVPGRSVGLELRRPVPAASAPAAGGKAAARPASAPTASAPARTAAGVALVVGASRGRLRPEQEEALKTCSRTHLRAAKVYPVVLMTVNGVPSLDLETGLAVRRNGGFIDCLKQVPGGLPEGVRIVISARVGK